ncbi:hypothetical protein AZE42_12402 [Rhizopogon vesiculosus]|uniref:Uncharacterized protein n=1 Tax=Rhizopogon vesiculosus TaxID=180088 RepID=A0A1J8R2A3_9AGAM|nr:hypothetical protein AZE42_12402 [Rhizopogon vesiculosus]
MAPDRKTGGHKCTQISSQKVQCQYCNKSYNSRGMKLHKDSCHQRKEKEKDDRVFVWAAVQLILKEGKHKCHHDKMGTHMEPTVSMEVLQLSQVPQTNHFSYLNVKHKSKHSRHVTQPCLPFTYIASQCHPITPSHITSSPLQSTHISPITSPINLPIDLP